MSHAISVQSAFSNGWKTFTARPWFYVGLTAILIAVALVPQMLTFALEMVSPQNLENADVATIGVAAAAGYLGLIVSLLSWAVQQYFALGVVRVTLDGARGRAVSFGSLRVEPVVFLNYSLAAVLVAIIVLAGFLLFIIPGIYASLALSLVAYVVIDQKVGPVEGVQRSWNLTKGNRGRLFLMWLASAGVNFLGILALGIGLFVSIPLTWLAMADVYRQLADKKTP